MKIWLKRIAIGLATLVFALAILGLDFVRSFKSSVPSYDGTLTAPVGAQLTVTRDLYAIPHIAAQDFNDAAFALGYVHAQDRLWQMEVSRRMVQGRLAEMFGSLAVSSDRTMRSFGLYRAAEAAVPHLAADTRRALQRYAEGVNAFLALHQGRLPIEFSLAGVRPEPWKPADSVAVLKAMALTLSGNGYGEAARMRLMGLLGRSSVSNFMAPFGTPLPAYLDEIYGATRLGSDIGIPNISASNNWVVDGARSVSGKPLLANDPHLGFSLPSTWYLAHMSFGDEDIAGGTLAGIPAIIAGRNRHVAWGITNTGPDTQDLYLERINPDNPLQYQTPNGWAEFTSRRETIKVRFGADQAILVRETRHGPVMDLSENSRFSGIAPQDYVLSLAWTALAPDDTTMDTLLLLGRAEDADDLRAALGATVAPMQSVVYADDNGEIGLALPGRVPLRAEQNDSKGLVPAPGWEARYDWQGFLPAEAADIIRNPPSGQIVTANNKVVPDSYNFRLTYEWDQPYRHDRIDALLAATSRHSVGTFVTIQNDIVDTYAVSLMRRLTEAAPFSATQTEAITRMARWNGAMSGGRPEPLIFAAWARALSQRLYADELGEAFSSGWGYRTDLTLQVLDDTGGQSRWCDDRATLEIEDCPSRIRLALDDALTELTAAYGHDIDSWRWDVAHPAVHSARPLSDIPLIGGYFRREVPMEGGPFTVRRADNAMGSKRPYAAIHGSGYRGIYDLGSPDASRYVISTGQSGNVYSPHYDDLLPLWADGAYVSIPFDRQAIDAQAKHRLTLQPQPQPMKDVQVP